MTFVEEIKQSKAFKLTASYLGICFIALQVLDPLSERDIIDESLFKILVYNHVYHTYKNKFLLPHYDRTESLFPGDCMDNVVKNADKWGIAW